MKAKELRGRQPEDLKRELSGMQAQLFDMQFRQQSEERPDTSHKGKLRKDIARIETVLREIELQEQGA